MQTLWTVQQVLNWTVDYFSRHQIAEPRLSAELLLAHTLQCRRIDLYVQFERILTPRERHTFREYVHRRVRREPVQYILGETEFYGLPLQIRPGVFIPRPETELLVDSVIEEIDRRKIQNPDILDVGTGSGCIAIALAKHLSEAHIQAIDNNPRAIELARENGRRHGVTLRWETGDVFQFLSRTSLTFHLLVTNPPYIAETDWAALPPEVREYEPREALYGGSDGLEFYRRLMPLLPNVLHQPGSIVLETGYHQAASVADMLAQKGLKPEIRKDYQQIKRVVIGRI